MKLNEQTSRKPLRSTALFIVLMVCLLATSCGKGIELAGYAWNAEVVSSGAGGVYTPFSMAFVCNTESSGVAFFAETYPDDPMPYGTAVRFSYTWDGDEGSFQLDDGSGISLPVYYEKRSEKPAVVVDITPMRDYFQRYATEYSLERTEYYSPQSVDGTHWEFSFDGGDAHYSYSLGFGSDTALLRLDCTNADGDTAVVTWTITEYSYAEGVGRMKIRSDAFNVYFNGYFYLPDEHHLNFFDSENLLPMSRYER